VGCLIKEIEAIDMKTKIFYEETRKIGNPGIIFNKENRKADPLLALPHFEKQKWGRRIPSVFEEMGVC
jgi:hypothetical protein